MQNTNFVVEEHDAYSSIMKSYRKKLAYQRNVDKKRGQAVKNEWGKTREEFFSIRTALQVHQKSWDSKLVSARKELLIKLQEKQELANTLSLSPSVSRRGIISSVKGILEAGTVLGTFSLDIMYLAREMQRAALNDDGKPSERIFHRFVRKQVGLQKETARKVASAYLLILLFMPDAVATIHYKIEDLVKDIAKHHKADGDLLGF